MCDLGQLTFLLITTVPLQVGWGLTHPVMICTPSV